MLSLDNPELVKVLRAVGLAENERKPAPHRLIAEKCGLEVSEVKSRLVEAHRAGLVNYFNGHNEGWSLTPEGQATTEEG